MKMKLLAKLGFVVLATGASFGVGSPVDADQPDWVKSERVQFLKAVRIEPLRSRLHKGTQMPAAKIEQEKGFRTLNDVVLTKDGSTFTRACLS
jgi:hypothetical protein